MSNLCIKFDDAKEVIKNILEQFYGLKEDTSENEFENTIEYLFQELEQKCFYPTSDPIDYELKVLKQVVLKVDEYEQFITEHPDSISMDYLHAVRDLTNELDEILRGDDND